MIKNLIVSAVLLFCIYSNSLSQTEKGARLVGGNGYLNLKDNVAFSLTPNYGHFIIDDLAIGATSSIDYFNNSDYFRDFGVSIGPFIRYYIGSSGNKLLLTGNFGVGSSARRDLVNIHSKSAFHAGFGVGFVHFITKQVGVEAILNYRNNWGSEYVYDELFISLGFQIHLPSKH